MSDVNADNWNAIFYGEGHQDVQLTNQIYRQRYGLVGVSTNPDVSNSGAAGYNSTPVYTDAAGTQTALPTPIRGTSPTPAPQPTQAHTATSPTQQTNTQTPTNQQPTGQGQIPPNAQTSPQDLLKEFLESDPDLMLNMVANHFRDMGASNVFMQWFVGNFRNFWGRYLGYVAEQAAGGQIPTLSFVDWVMQYDVNRSFYENGAARQGLGQSSATFANYVTAQGAV